MIAVEVLGLASDLKKRQRGLVRVGLMIIASARVLLPVRTPRDGKLVTVDPKDKMVVDGSYKRRRLLKGGLWRGAWHALLKQRPLEQ